MNMNNWQIKKLKYFLKVKHGKDQKLVEDKNGIYPILASGGEISRTNRYLYNKPSVLIGRKGTIDKPQYIENPFWTIDTLFYTEINDNNKPKFFYYLFQTINWYKYNEGSTVPSLNSTTIESIIVKVPPLAEQEKIVSILSKQDEVIEKLEDLIELKIKQKKGLMQKLLSGKVRLNRFNGEWKNLKANELFLFYKGEQLNKTNMLENGLYPVLNGGVSFSGYTDKYNTLEDTITISEGGNSCGFVNRVNCKFWSGGHCYNLYDIKINKDFLYYILKYNECNIMKLRVGSGLPNIQKSSIENLAFYIPIDKNEQSAIASILSKCDKEIELLKKKLELHKKQKKWLMQKLLSGEIRVKEV